MRVTIDLDPKDVWRIQHIAEKQGITPGEVVRSEMSARRTRNLAEAIGERVRAGMCDADIGDEFGMTLASVATPRRKLGLRANPHPQRGKRVGRDAGPSSSKEEAA